MDEKTKYLFKKNLVGIALELSKHLGIACIASGVQ